MTRSLTRPVSLLTLLIGAIALITAACGGGNDTPQSLTLNIKVDPASLDPARGVGTESISVQRQLFRGLVRFNEDLAIIPDVAESIPSLENGGVSDDGRVYVFQIRDGAEWSDSRPVTAEDFAFALRRVLDLTLASELAAAFYGIDGAAAYNTALTGEDSRPAA